MTTLRLLGIHYSAWTERARWALEHHGLRYRYQEHVPLLGEAKLRWVLRREGGGPASVPLLFDGPWVTRDSLEIMQYADRVGGAASLGAGSDTVERWVAEAEPCLHAMRVRVTARILADPDALKEAASSGVPAAVAGAFKPLAVIGARHIARKYRFNPAESAAGAAAMRAFLQQLRARIAGKPTIGYHFSALDIVGAGALQGVRPIPGHRGIGPHTTRMWANDALADEFADLVEWRDALVAAHLPSLGA